MMKVKEESGKVGLKFNIQKKKRSWHLVPSLHANRWGNNGNSDRLYFLGLQNHCRWWLQPWNWKTHTPWKKSYDQPAAAAKSLQSCPTLCNPWTAAHQASLSVTNSQSLLKLMSIESVMPSNHLIVCQSTVWLSKNLAEVDWIGQTHSFIWLLNECLLYVRH